MFSIFKSKPLLKDLIPTNYIDIHSHLLPGIDDGSRNIVDTIYLTNEIAKMGFKKAITTPHVIKNVWNNSRNDIENLLEKTKIDLKSNAVDLQIHAAAEYMMDIDFIALFKSEKLLTLKDNFVLVEMSYLSPPIQLYEIIFELQIAGYIPVLAHPERYNYLHNNFAAYLQLKKSGCLFQLNLLSNIGYYGDDVSKIADKLLENELIDFVGSDLHHQNHLDGFYKKVKIKNINLLEKAISKNDFF